MSVIYKAVPGHPGYRAGDDGSIWSAWRMRGRGRGKKAEKYISDEWRQLKGYVLKAKGNRKIFTLRRPDGSFRHNYAAVFILLTFVGPAPTDAHEACHIDDDCTNDRVGNLRWGTRAENAQDMVRNGRSRRGEAVNTAKLTESDVRAILASSDSNAALAKKYGVHITLVWQIRKRKIWKHLK